MTEHARCTCILAFDQAKQVNVRMRRLDCPIHGANAPDPLVAWRLSENDRRMLRINGIDV